jgi:hypothetical protein
VTNVQLYLAVGIPFFAVLIGLVFNNIRINDMRDLLRAEIQTSRAESKADIAELRGEFAELRAEMRGMRQLIDAIMGKLDELDRRSTRGI